MKAFMLSVIAAAVAGAAYAASPAYVAETAVVLPSTDTGWDYITLEKGGPRLFSARRQDGLLVFDTKTGKPVGTVENSVGANGVVLVPEFNRAYTAMTDGTVLVFDLQTLRPIDRFK